MTRCTRGLARLVALPLVALLLAACSVSIQPVRPTPPATQNPTPSVSRSGDPTADPTVADPRESATSSIPTVTATAAPKPTAARPPSFAPISHPTPAAQSTQVAHEQPAQPTSDTSRASLTPTPPAAPAPTAQPSPTPAPTATPPMMPSCDQEPIRGFGLVWHDHPEVAQVIGCPVADEIGLSAKIQSYQHGFMLWLDTTAPSPPLDDASWVVAFAGTLATRTRVSAPVTWQPDTVSPTGAFAWVGDNVYTDAQRLGPATTVASDTDAAIQRFEHGTMIWVKNAPGGRPMVYVVSGDLTTTASGSFQAFVDTSFQ